MNVADSIYAINARKAAVLDDPDRSSEGALVELDDWRPVLVGLDLDIVEVERVTTGCAQHTIGWATRGMDPLLALRALAFDMFVAGVYYERERSGAASGDDSA